MNLKNIKYWFCRDIRFITEKQAENFKEDGCFRIGDKIIHKKGCKHMNWVEVIYVTRPRRYRDPDMIDYYRTLDKYQALYPKSQINIDYANIPTEILKKEFISKIKPKKPSFRERWRNPVNDCVNKWWFPLCIACIFLAIIINLIGIFL